MLACVTMLGCPPFLTNWMLSFNSKIGRARDNFFLLLFCLVLLLLVLRVFVIKRVDTSAHVGKERKVVSIIIITLTGVGKSKKL